MKITVIVVAILLWSGLTGCDRRGDNRLTEEEKSEGYSLLFNGKNYDGWKMFNGNSVTGWIVEDGCMVALGKGGDIGGDIVTTEEFGNFQLKWEWKIGEKGNSGLMYHVHEGDRYKAPYETGAEYQMSDDARYAEFGPNGEVGFYDYRKTGCNYEMYKPDINCQKPVGEWNSSMLIYHNGRVEHYLNGEKLFEFQEGSDDWVERRTSGKWSKYPDYCAKPYGKLALQDHGSMVFFKNIKIKKRT